MLNTGNILQKRLDEMKKFYPDVNVTVHVQERKEEITKDYEQHTIFRDLEDGGIWDWNYHTTPGYSREDGWWYERPVKRSGQ